MNIPFSPNLWSPNFSTAFVLCFSAMIFLSSCGKDNDDVLSSPLDGSWAHESHTCGFSPQVPLENESYNWSIDTIRKRLTVTSSYNSDFICLPLPGIYNITVDTTKIVIESISYDYSVTAENLVVLDNPASDGPLFNFIKGK